MTALQMACAAAIDIPLVNGTGTVTGTRAGAVDHTFATCGGSARPDVVYQFTTTAPGTVVVELTPSDAQQQLIGSLRSTCDQSTTEVTNSCLAAADPGGAVLLHQRGLAAGTWYLWVDGFRTPVGGFTAKVTFTPEAGDSCSAPVLLTPSNGEVNVAGSTLNAANDATFSCGSASSADVVYQLDLTATSNVVVLPASRSGGLSPLLALRSATCTGSEVACRAASQALGVSTLAAGSYFLWVDGSTTAAGAFSLQVKVGPPPDGDLCAAPKVLTLSNGPAGGTATDTSSTTFALPNGGASCGALNGGDVVYTFTTNVPLDLRATATSSTSGYTPALSLRSASCTGAELACVGGTTLVRAQLPAGTWFLWVGGNTQGGSYQLDVALTPQLVGEVCANPKGLTFIGTDGGVATDVDDTRRFFNDTAPSCAFNGGGGDVAYAFSTSTVWDFFATVSTTDAVYRPAVVLRSACASSTTLACGAALTGGPAGLFSPGLPPGDYVLWVDGESNTSGPYTLSARVQRPPPGDTCLNPITLPFSGGGGAGSASASGDLRSLTNQGSGSCMGGGSPDVVYVFTTNTVLDLRATAQSTLATYGPAIYLREGNCSGGDRSCATSLVNGGAAVLGAGALAPGTWYLWVDGQGGSVGTYDLTATLSAPTPGEACLTALPLTFTGGTATASGDLTNNLPDNSSTCGAFASPDVVYSFTTTVTQNFSATVSTTSSTYRPLLSLRTTTCTGMERCVSASTAGAPATLSVTALPAGTYYLWVDGASGTAGPFSLSATLQ